MKAFTSYITSVAAAVVMVASFAPILPAEVLPQVMAPEIAYAAASSPTAFRVSVRDHNCSDQEGYSDYANPNGASPATDQNRKDPDCARIEFIPGDVANTPANQSIYTNDFRIGTRLAESENGCGRDSGAIQWTPWLSEGGGVSWGARANGNVNDPDCVWIYYEVGNPLPSSVRVNNVRVGIGSGYGSFAYTPWARSGGGFSNSGGNKAGGAYSGGGNVSPAQLHLDVQMVDVYDAEYVSDTVPDAMSVGESGNYEIVMRNKATAWQSNGYYASNTDNCTSQTPTQVGQTCTASVDLSSNNIKLQRIDSDTDVELISPTSSPLKYKRTVNRTYTAGDYCIVFTGSSEDTLLHKVSGTFIKEAQARSMDDPDPEDPGPVCRQWGLRYFLSSQTPVNSNIINTDTGKFPVSLRIQPGAAAGNHNLRFRMVNTNTNEQFGSEGVITITIGSGNMLTCTASQTVMQGTTANYGITATVPSDFNAPITVSMTSNPAGPVASPATTVLNAPGYAGLMSVPTTTVTPGTYTLTFTGTAAGLNPSPTCNSSLTVTPEILPPSANLRFNNQEGPVTVGNNASGTLSWTTSNVSSCSASSAPSTSWNGSRAVSEGTYATEGVGPLAGPASYTFILTCTNASGQSAVDQVIVNAGGATAPTADLKCLGDTSKSYSDGPCTVPYGGSGLLAWTSTAATDCTIAPTLGREINTNETDVNTSSMTSTTTYTLTCNGSGGTTTDSVTFEISATQSFAIACSPNLASRQQGTSGPTHTIDVSGYQGFNGQVALSGQFVGSIVPNPAPTIGFTNANPTPGMVASVVNVPGNTTPGTYSIRYTGTVGGTTRTATCALAVTQVSTPNGPTDVASNNSVCGAVDIGWDRPSGGTNPERYNVYRKSKPSDPWGAPIGSVVVAGYSAPGDGLSSQKTYVYRDTSATQGESYYYAVTAVAGGVQSAYIEAYPAPINVTTCNANWSRSDKDMLSVGAQTNTNAARCNSTSDDLPEQIYTAGDEVAFAINVCNSGNSPLTNISVEDDLSNNLINPRDWKYSGCDERRKPVVNGNLVTVYPTDVPEQTGSEPSVCRIEFKATLKPYNGPDGTFYRFLNIARVRAAQYNTVLTLRTPLKMYREGSGVPVRNETGP